MRAIKKVKKLMFNIHEIVWWFVAEIEDWLYPYYDRMTPDEQYEMRVKDPITGEMQMVEQHIQGLNERVERLQEEMLWAKDKIYKLENPHSWGVVDGEE